MRILTDALAFFIPPIVSYPHAKTCAIHSNTFACIYRREIMVTEGEEQQRQVGSAKFLPCVLRACASAAPLSLLIISNHIHMDNEDNGPDFSIYQRPSDWEGF